MNDKAKRTKPSKPQSPLQKACTACSWFKNYTLQRTNVSTLYRVMPVSKRTATLAYRRDLITAELKVSVTVDYEAYKKLTLANRANQKAKPDIPF